MTTVGALITEKAYLILSEHHKDLWDRLGIEVVGIEELDGDEVGDEGPNLLLDLKVKRDLPDGTLLFVRVGRVVEGENGPVMDKSAYGATPLIDGERRDDLTWWG
jgi:hypothetical protein